VRRKAVFLCILSCLAFSLPAQADKPVWLLLEEASEAREKKDPGRAVELYRKALEQSPGNPEALSGFASVLKDEGEYELSEHYYLMALAAKKDLYIIEDQYRIGYELADLYYMTRQYKKFEKTLLDIMASDPIYADPQNAALKNAMVSTLKRSGIDKLVELFRPNNPIAVDAHTELGIFYYRSGRYSEASQELMFSVLTPFTRIVERLKKEDPEFQYRDAKTLVRYALMDEKLVSYVEESSLFMGLYYLAASLYAEGYDAFAKEIWDIVASFPEAGTYASRASRQIRSPYIEPLIGIE